MRRLLIVVSMALVSLPLPGPADIFDWRPLGKSAEGVPLYYDAERLEYPARDTVGAVVKGAYGELDTPPSGKEHYGYSESAVEFRCLEGLYRAVETTIYSKDGSLIKGASPFPEQWSGVGPGSAMERLHRALCPSPKRRQPAPKP